METFSLQIPHAHPTKKKNTGEMDKEARLALMTSDFKQG